MRARWTAAQIQGQVTQGVAWFKFPERETWHYRWRQFKTPLAVVSFLLVYGVIVYTSGFYMADVTLQPPKCFGDGTPANETDMSYLAKHLWRPYLHNIASKSFVANNGEQYKIPSGAHRWTQPLGKKLIILDVDSRPNTNTGEILNSEKPDRTKITGRTAGFMNHYLYSLIHGYDYRLVRAPNYNDRHGTWVKVPMIREALKTHDTVVFLDADAEFVHPQLPLEWLMSLWNIKPQTLVAMAEDPDAKWNQDDKGRVLWNTGFVIARRSNRTQEMFDTWENCPTSKRYPGCDRWLNEWAHEQAAFGYHLRYDYNGTDELRVLSCDQANGAPYIGNDKCRGVFVSHHWGDKDRTIQNFYNSILDLFIQRLHRQFHDEKSRYFLDASSYQYPLDNLFI
ncbi:hypothetical protein V8C42DRAFT_335167 [Trichoderma barbatum]